LMEAPRIQYAKTTDGVNIAYWTLGVGRPLILPPSLVASHLQLEWEVGPIRTNIESLAEHAQVVRYEARGVGLSRCDELDFSPLAGSRDLQAVVDKLELHEFTIITNQTCGDGPLLYAADHPDRVASLVHRLRPLPFFSNENQSRLSLIEPLADQNWDFFCDIY